MDGDWKSQLPSLQQEKRWTNNINNSSQIRESKLLPWKLEGQVGGYRGSQLFAVKCSEAEATTRNSTSRNRSLSGQEWELKKSRRPRLKVWECSQPFVGFPSRKNSLGRWKSLPVLLPGKEKKKAFFKTPRTLCSLSLPLRKTVSLEHATFGFYKSLADLGDKNYPNASPSILHCGGWDDSSPLLLGNEYKAHQTSSAEDAETGIHLGWGCLCAAFQERGQVPHGSS